MAQLNITLNQEEIQALLLDDRGVQDYNTCWTIEEKSYEEYGLMGYS